MFVLATNSIFFMFCFKLPIFILLNVLVNYNNPVSNKSVVYVYYLLFYKKIYYFW